MLTVAVLGPVEVRRDGEVLPLPAGKSTEVLVRLALDAGRVVRTERIIDDLWADAAATTGKNTLQSKISQLRRALGDAATITSGSGGYVLDVDPDDIDALRVTGLAHAAAARRSAGDPSASLAAATEALALFRGEVLVDAGDGEWLTAHRVRLEEVRLGLVEDSLAARAELGSGGDVIGELEALVQEHPLHEGLWAVLITALYRSGRQADALAAYTRVREALLDELGIDPGPALRALESRVLQQHPDLDATPVAPTPVSATPSHGASGNLPSLSSPLVGRVDDLDRLEGLVGSTRLVTFVGPAGVGKTRLAVEAARRDRPQGGAWLVRLDAVDDPADVGRVVAETLQVAGGEPMLADRLAGSDTLLVIDNCEHVVDAVADLVGSLLDVCSQLRVLATSQLPLGLDGEIVELVQPLPIADSMALFAGRANELRRGFVLDDDTAVVVEEVCRSLDGLPLAIELAAARVKSLSVAEIARRLDDRFALLRDPSSRRPERRRALAGAIGWSYDLLFPDDQRGLWALSVFAGGAELAAVEHVIEALGVPRSAAIDVIDRLVDRSLVEVERTDDGSARYRLLDSIRAFSADRLDEHGGTDAAAAHAAWFAEAARRCNERVRGHGQAECVHVVRTERANVDAALAWCAEHDPALGLVIAIGFGWTWVVLGDGVIGAARVRRALDASRADAETPVVAAALLLAGWLEASAGDVAVADADLTEATALADGLDGPAGELLQADALRHRAFLRIQQGRAAEVLDDTAKALAIDGAAGRDWEVTGSLLLAAFGALMVGDIAAADAAAAEAVGLLESIGDAWGTVHAQAMLGAIAQGDGRLDDAATALRSAAAASESLGFLGQAALHLTTLGRIEQRTGDHASAMATLRRAVAASATAGDARIAATARVTWSRSARATGDHVAAGDLLASASQWYATAGGDGALLARALSEALAIATDPAIPTSGLEAVLDDARAAADTEVELVVLDAVARRAALDGRTDVALDRLREADDRAAAIAHLVDDADRVDAAAARQLISGP